MNESVKSDYERQIASLQSSTNLMSQNLSKLQLKYDKWRSRGRTSFVKKRDVGTSVNDAQQERKVDKMTHCGSVASHSRQFELKMQLLSKNMEIVDQRDQLNSLELAFRTQIEEIERQLKELVCLKRSQDEKILALKRQQTNHRTVRSSRLHCPPSKSMPPTSEVMVQTQISPKTESASTMTNSKYVVSSRAEDVVAKLEKDLIMKTNQISELEDTCRSTVETVNKLKLELEESKAALAQKCSELEHEKLRPKPRERQGFRSKACQTKPKGCCSQGVDAMLVKTREVECQVSETERASSNFPGFLTEALITLGENCRTICSSSSGTRNEGVFVNRNNATSQDELQAQTQVLQSPDFAITLPSRTEVDVSVDVTDASQCSGTNVQALMADWKSTEDRLINQLTNCATVMSPTWLTAIATSQEASTATAALDAAVAAQQGQYPTASAVPQAPVVAITSSTTPASSSISGSERAEASHFSSSWFPTEEQCFDLNRRPAPVLECNQPETAIPSLARPVAGASVPRPPTKCQRVKARLPRASEVPTRSSVVSAAGDTWDDTCGRKARALVFICSPRPFILVHFTPSSRLTSFNDRIWPIFRRCVPFVESDSLSFLVKNHFCQRFLFGALLLH
uniref:CEP63 domain-containing protein n=1 Tax=Mesocestoides corti TaxID=53468 RepID=A0A5K3F3D8_MESCO